MGRIATVAKLFTLAAVATGVVTLGATAAHADRDHTGGPVSTAELPADPEPTSSPSPEPTSSPSPDSGRSGNNPWD